MRTEMRGPLRRAGLALALAALLAMSGLASAGCGSDEPESAFTEAELQAAVKGAPEPLERLYARRGTGGGGLIDGDPAAYKRQIAALRGYPIVVNKWASWCGPCKLEFPFFQEAVARQGKKVAFLAVDVQDVREDAEEFLKETP
ncbi:MAG: TlpA disulfide reductase family protein, partial [Thermoleophilaceae bacterium]